MSQIPVEDGNTVISKSLDYKIQSSSTPHYQMNLLVPQSGTQTVTVQSSSSIESLIELPAGKAYNLSRSELSFYAIVAASGADKYNFLPTDACPMISRLQLMTRGGVYLADINNCHKYLNVVQKANISNSDFLNRCSNEFLYPNNCLNTTGVTAQASSYHFNGDLSTKSFVEPAYQAVGTNNTATPLQQFSLKLGDIPHSIFSLDKDLYFNEILVLRIEWAPANSYLWYGTNPLNPATGAVAYAQNTTSIQNLSLYLSIETDDMIVQSLRSKVMGSGLDVLIPYVWSFKNNIAGVNQNVSLRFNSAHGLALCKVYTAPFHATETANTVMDHSNIGITGSKVNSYYTMVDNQRVTPYDLNCGITGNTNYMYMRPQLKGTPLEDIDVYKYNWFHADDFCKDREVNNDPNVVNGLPLTSQEKKIDIMATCVSATYNWYTFAITKRKLHIGSTQIVVQ